MSQLVALQYNDQISVNFTQDAWFNATEVASHFGKRTNDFLNLESTKQYISALEEILLRENPINETKCEESSHFKYQENWYLKTRRGKYNGGTWFHPDLAVAFARWLDVTFSIWCDRQIKKLLTPKVDASLLESSPITKTQYGVLSAIISDIATASGKEGTTKVALWSRFSTHFKISSSKDLPAFKFDEAKSYLESKRAEYDKGFTLAVVKKDDLQSLGYDNDTKMFAVRALEHQKPKTTWNGNGHVSMILGVEGDQRLVVQEHNEMTVIMKLNPDDFVGTFETVVRELKLRGYVVMKKDDLADKLSVLVA